MIYCIQQQWLKERASLVVLFINSKGSKKDPCCPAYEIVIVPVSFQGKSSNLSLRARITYFMLKNLENKSDSRILSMSGNGIKFNAPS